MDAFRAFRSTASRKAERSGGASHEWLFERAVRRASPRDDPDSCWGPFHSWPRSRSAVPGMTSRCSALFSCGATCPVDFFRPLFGRSKRGPRLRVDKSSLDSSRSYGLTDHPTLGFVHMSETAHLIEPTYYQNMNDKPYLLWVDCTGAAVVGVAVILLSGWLSELEGLPRNVILFTGVVNLLYGSFSFSLAVRKRRPMRWIKALVWANLAWTPVCVGSLSRFGRPSPIRRRASAGRRRVRRRACTSGVAAPRPARDGTRPARCCTRGRPSLI